MRRVRNSIVLDWVSLEANQAIEKEKEARIASEKENMGKLNESLFLVKENLKEEKDQRNSKIN